MGSEIKIKHLLDQNFKDEIIEDYMCIYCSLREYLFNYMKSDKNDPKLKDEILQKQMYPKWQISSGLSKQEASDFKDSLQFFHRIYQTQDIDEEQFLKQYNNYKTLTNNKS